MKIRQKGILGMNKYAYKQWGLAILLALSLRSAGTAAEEGTIGPTIEELTARTIPTAMVEYEGGFSLEVTYHGFEDESTNQKKISHVFVKDGDYIKINEENYYSEDDYSRFYFTTEPDSEYQYMTATQLGTDAFIDEIREAILDISILGYEDFAVEKLSVEETEDRYLMNIAIKSGENVLAKDEVTVDKQSGAVLRLVRRINYQMAEDPQMENAAEDEGSVAVTEIVYASDLEVLPLFDAEELSARLSFDTVDLNGNPVNTDIIRDAKVVMVNFWEPWCGPCVGEMPELQELYETYKDQGLLILGVYSEENTRESVEEIVEETKVQYPILQKDKSLAIFCGNYVPVTVFADGEGKILTEEPIIGAKSKEEWEAIILGYLK